MVEKNEDVVRFLYQGFNGSMKYAASLVVRKEGRKLLECII